MTTTPTAPPSAAPSSAFFTPLALGSDVERARADEARRLLVELGGAS